MNKGDARFWCTQVWGPFLVCGRDVQARDQIILDPVVAFASSGAFWL